MQYYRLVEYSGRFKGAYWAEGIRYADSQNVDFSKPETVCPLCGRAVSGFAWLEPHNIKLSGKRVGNFVFSTAGLLCNERCKDLIQQRGIKGVEEFMPVNTFYKKGCPTEQPYYLMKIAYSNKKYDYAVQQNERRKSDKSLPKCSLCMRSGNGLTNAFREIYFDDQDEYDIFRVYEKRTNIYCNERFIQFCKDNKLTNIVEWFVKV